MKSRNCSVGEMKNIYVTLKKRGVDCQKKDNHKRTALHYAVINNSQNFVHMLLEENEDKGYNIN